MKCKAWWLKLFVAILLSIGCILQVKTSLDKFLSGKTTVAIQKRKQMTGPMPVVVVCPYNMFRLELMETNNMTVSVVTVVEFHSEAGEFQEFFASQ